MSYQNGPRPALPDGLLLECVVTTLNTNGAVHVAPMGPIVNRDMTRALLRPYQPSQTLDNLKRSPIGVLHVTDDVLLIAAAATGTLESPPATFPTRDQRGAVLADACRWHEFETISIDDSTQRAEVDCRVVDSGRLRDFLGFNRARHAVIEATILATRLHLLPHDDVARQLEQLAPAVEKTGGQREHAAFELVSQYVRSRIKLPSSVRAPA